MAASRSSSNSVATPILLSFKIAVVSDAFTEIGVPDVGETVESVKVEKWLVELGDEVREGQTVAVLSTDKANLDLPSPGHGYLVAMTASAGAVISPRSVIGLLADSQSFSSSALLDRLESISRRDVDLPGTGEYLDPSTGALRYPAAGALDEAQVDVKIRAQRAYDRSLAAGSVLGALVAAVVFALLVPGPSELHRFDYFMGLLTALAAGATVGMIFGALFGAMAGSIAKMIVLRKVLWLRDE